MEEYPVERFWRLFGSAVFRDLATQKSNPATGQPWEGGDLDPVECRHVFVSLVRLSYEYVKSWYDAFVLDVLAGLERECGPLTDAEKFLFCRTHRPSKYFGGLSAALLADRLWLLRPILQELWQLGPDEDVTPAARHAPDVLVVYGLALAARRSADRSRKRYRVRPRALYVEGSDGDIYIPEDVESAAKRDESSETLMKPAAELLKELKPPEGGCSKGAKHVWCLETVASSGEDDIDRKLTLIYACENCREKVEVPLEEEHKDRFFGLDQT